MTFTKKAAILGFLSHIPSLGYCRLQVSSPEKLHKKQRSQQQKKHFRSLVRTEGVQKRSWGYLHSLRRSGCSLSRVLDRRVAYVRVLMAVKLGEQAWRSSLLQSSQWQLRIMAERNGEYVLTVPVPLESVWRRFFGGQLWIRANISRQELNKFLEISQGGGVLSKDPNHLWISLCQGASRLVGGLGGDESVAFTTLMPSLFYK